MVSKLGDFKQVVDNAGHYRAGFVVVKVPERQLFDVMKEVLAHVALYTHAHDMSPILYYVCKECFQYIHKQQHSAPNQYQVQSLVGYVYADYVARNKREKQVAHRHEKGANHVDYKQPHVRTVV